MARGLVARLASAVPPAFGALAIACASCAYSMAQLPHSAEPFVEEWASEGVAMRSYAARAGANAKPGFRDPLALDGKALKLSIGSRCAAGPGGGSGAESVEAYLYGSFSCRMRAADADAGEGIVSAFFLYGNDGADRDGDGLADNAEIDFEWLSAEPGSVWLTCWTDYDERTGTHRHVVRKVRLATGTVEYTRYCERFDDGVSLSGPEAQPERIQAIPEYDSGARYYDYGIDREPGAVRWWIAHPETGERITLWDYRGPESRLPSAPARAMVNLWHSATWAPEASPEALAAPASWRSSYVDRVAYAPLE
jgi:hypothetical protein